MSKLTGLFLCGLILLSGPGWTNERTVGGSKADSARGATFEAPRSSPQVRHMPSLRNVSGSRAPATAKAWGLLALASKQDDDQAQATLQRIVTMDMPSSESADEVRSHAHEEIARFYDAAPAKQVVHLSLALQYTPDPARRSVLERRILDAGGDPFVAAFRNRRDPGPDDACLGAVAVGLSHSEIMNITPAGDHNWRSFDVPGPQDGAFVRIETISDFPGTGTDDTDLGLWDGCPSSGGTMIAFNEDKPSDFTSRIDSDCLSSGTYYVEVGGFFDETTADNFTLEIETVGSCVIPTIDSFESDDERVQGSSIGFPNSIPNQANGWGRSRKEIQSRSIFPQGDKDHAAFRLSRNELVRMGTAGQYPTFFNNFEGSDPADNPDTHLRLFYEGPVKYGGRCNQQDNGFLPICFTDADCPDPLANPIPGLPPCIPPFWGGCGTGVPTPYCALDDRPLALNADRSPLDRGSELLMCLPDTGPDTSSPTMQRWGGGFKLEILGETEFFNYELQVRNEVACLLESEPNNEFASATPLVLGDQIAGFYDFAATNPYADADLYGFDVDETTTIRFQTKAPDNLHSDTAFELFVGPDDSGDYILLATDEDGGSGFLSLLQVELPPASDLLGGTVTDADYFLNVTSNYFNTNFYYELESTVLTMTTETEPNDDSLTAGELEFGETIFARIDPACDLDTFRFEIETDTFITLSTPSGGDTAIELHRCSDIAEVLACDDDSGGFMRSSIDGCLPPGTYCAAVRAFSGFDTFAYDLELRGTPGCVATDPPALTGDGAFACLDFQSCP